MSPSGAYSLVEQERFPRVSGDEPQQVWEFKAPTGFSPRERG